jgi:hypothetical protein
MDDADEWGNAGSRNELWRERNAYTPYGHPTRDHCTSGDHGCDDDDGTRSNVRASSRDSDSRETC